MTVKDMQRLKLSDADVSNSFKNLVSRYAEDLAKNHSKGVVQVGAVASQRVSKIKRKKGQLIPSELLKAIRTAIWQAGWTQGVLKDDGGRMCLRGAFICLIEKGYAHNDDAQLACLYLHNEVRRKGGGSETYNFIYWNNDPKRTLAEVLKVLEDAANRASLAGE